MNKKEIKNKKMKVGIIFNKIISLIIIICLISEITSISIMKKKKSLGKKKHKSLYDHNSYQWASYSKNTEGSDGSAGANSGGNNGGGGWRGNRKKPSDWSYNGGGANGYKGCGSGDINATAGTRENQTPSLFVRH